MKKYALSLTSAFNTPSLLKSRIVMLYQKPSANFAKAKFGFALPVVCLCLIFSACLQRENPVARKAETTKLPSPRIIFQKNAQGEMIETIHYDGEKDAYEKTADAIGLNDFLAHKDSHTTSEVLVWYHKILPLALSQVEKAEDATNMQLALFGLLLQKGLHKSSRREDFTFIAEGLLKHPYSAYFFLCSHQESKWFQTALPKLKNYWSEGKWKAYTDKITTIYQKILESVGNTQIQNNAQNILQLIQKM